MKGDMLIVVSPIKSSYCDKIIAFDRSKARYFLAANSQSAVLSGDVTRYFSARFSLSLSYAQCQWRYEYSSAHVWYTKIVCIILRTPKNE